MGGSVTQEDEEGLRKRFNKFFDMVIRQGPRSSFVITDAYITSLENLALRGKEKERPLIAYSLADKEHAFRALEEWAQLNQQTFKVTKVAVGNAVALLVEFEQAAPIGPQALNLEKWVMTRGENYV